MASLLDLVQETITPDLSLKVGALVGETPAATGPALHRAAAAVLEAVLGDASTAAGAERVQSLVSEGGWGADLLRNLGARLAAGPGTGNLLSSGARLASALLGARIEGITDLVVRGSGVQRASASTILALAAPIVMSVVGWQIAARGLGPAGLVSMLAAERATLMSAMPAEITGLLGPGDLERGVAGASDGMAGMRTRDVSGAPEASECGPPGTAAASAVSRWWPALLVGLAAVAMLFVLTWGRPADVASTRITSPAAWMREAADVTLPGGNRISVSPGGSVHQLSMFLASSAIDLPRRYLIEDLHFENGSSRLTPSSRRTVDSLLAVLAAHPRVQVILEGHTDATGDTDADKALSRQRAEAVKHVLTAGGVAADRLKAEGHGQERPLTDNDTEAGRARNRRLELVVVQR
jgi:outer membrane protein OmpA-like peptidoglycan-associated protein